MSDTPRSSRVGSTSLHRNVFFAAVRLMTRPAPCAAEFMDSGLPRPRTT